MGFSIRHHNKIAAGPVAECFANLSESNFLSKVKFSSGMSNIESIHTLRIIIIRSPLNSNRQNIPKGNSEGIEQLVITICGEFRRNAINVNLSTIILKGKITIGLTCNIGNLTAKLIPSVIFSSSEELSNCYLREFCRLFNRVWVWI